MKKWILCMAVCLVLLLSGCTMQSVDEMYRLPKRSEEFTNLQSVITGVMSGLEYSAPIAGENRQTVQTADLDGDGNSEHIIFAKGEAEKPLQIFILSNFGGKFSLLDTIVCNGTAFEQVEYVELNGLPGYEIVVGRQVSNQVPRSVSVYTLTGGRLEQLLTTNYAKYLCGDLQGTGLSQLFVLRPGAAEQDNALAELFHFENGTVERSAQASLSAPVDQLMRIIPGKLEGGQNAVFAASAVEQSALVTDVFAVVDGRFINVNLSTNSATGVETLRNYYVYGDDIDNDGILELPTLITMKISDDADSSRQQHLIRWYSMKPDGSKVVKRHTYHNYEGGWYMELDSAIAERFTVIQRGNGFYFYLWDEYGTTTREIMSVYVLTGSKREEQATEANRFVLYRTESTVYAARLEVSAAAHGMTKENVITAFHLILQDWKTGKT